MVQPEGWTVDIRIAKHEALPTCSLVANIYLNKYKLRLIDPTSHYTRPYLDHLSYLYLILVPVYT